MTQSIQSPAKASFTIYEAATGQDHFAAPPPRRYGALGLVLNEYGEVLMCERNPIPELRKPWYHPGGCAEKNENIRAACIRSAREKLGITLTPGAVLSMHHMADEEHFHPDSGETSFSHEGMNWILDCGEIPKDTEFVFGAGVIGARWFKPSELKEYLAPFTAERTLSALRTRAALRALSTLRGLDADLVELLSGHPNW